MGGTFCNCSTPSKNEDALLQEAKTKQNTSKRRSNESEDCNEILVKQNMGETKEDKYEEEAKAKAEEYIKKEKEKLGRLRAKFNEVIEGGGAQMKLVERYGEHIKPYEHDIMVFIEANKNELFEEKQTNEDACVKRVNFVSKVYTKW
eukprot:918727_1